MIKKVKSRLFLFVILCAVLFIAFSLTSCHDNSNTPQSQSSRGSYDEFLIPSASGQEVYTGGNATIDCSNASQGYIMAKYDGPAAKAKLQITGSDGEIYTYTLKTHSFEAFALTTGSGNYKIDILANVTGDLYSLALSETISMSLKDEFSPFLYPNQYVWFTEEMDTMELAIKLSEGSSDDLNFVENVYEYVITNIEYDDNKAANVPLDYIPNIEDTLRTGKGICFDYASLMAAILRSQKIPTKLVVGYSGATYHAWISVYTEETGWVDGIIQFNGKSWSLMDPTIASANDNSSIKEYINNESNYIVKYNY